MTSNNEKYLEERAAAKKHSGSFGGMIYNTFKPRILAGEPVRDSEIDDAIEVALRVRRKVNDL